MFNSSTRKDDVSLKLRSQNLRNAKQQTKALEAESRRMEDRLQELKVAMTREKEEREAQGGGFWQKGQTGNLSNYAQDVLKKPKKGSSASSNREKSSKKGRVKVLKDEPILVPDRNKAPGTMGNIAQRNLFSSKEKIKGPKCGQCEQKAANVSCQECGEDYCAGCFAAFHLRGALKKHRSVPVGNMGMRPNMTPRTTSSDNNPSQKNSACSVRPGHEDDNYRNKNYAVHDHHSPVGSRHDGDNVLLRGDYDEQANAAEFAAALAAWRTSKAEPEQPATPKVQPKLRTIGPRTVPHHAASADSGTSTQEVEKPALEIRFKSSLTYAERLLLKRNRRIEREEFEGHVTLDDVMEMVTPHDSAPHDVDPFKESAHMMPGRLEPFYHTTQSHLAGDLETTQWSDEEVERSESRISIIMVNENVPAHQLRGYEQSSNYEVMEGPDNTIYHKNQSSVSPDVQHTRYAFATPPTSGRPSPSGRRSACMRRSYTVSPISAALKANKENLDDLDTQLTISQNVLLQKKNGDQSTRQTPINSARISAKTSAQSVKSEKKERPVSRTKSRTASQAAYRPSSGQLGSARPGSRAKSRTYMYGEGLLTKGPSESLKDVARLAGQAAALQYQKVDLSSFFTVGVKPAPVLDRVLTLRGQRTKQPEAGIEKWRVSNKLYTMGPRSWRPDSSLGNNVDGQQVADYVQDQGVAALEQMSNDIMGDALTPYDREQSTLSWSYSEHVLGDTKPEGRLQQMSTTRKSWQMSAVMPEQYSTVPEPSATPTRYPIAERYLTAEPASSVHTSTRTSRERSMYMQEKRDQAFQQSEDIVSADLPRPSSGLRPNPLGASGSRSSTPNIHTPRPNSRGVVRPDSGRPGSRTPVINHSNSSLYMIPSSLHGVYEGRMTPSRPISVSGRESRAIVIDGDDLTRFDELAMHEDDADDEEAIGQLEWELASQEGRLTADGQISRMSVIDPDPEIYIPEDTSPCSDLDSMPPPHQDVLERQIRESVLMDDFAEMEDQFMADEVAALH